MCRRRANYARSRLQKLVGKARKGFFDSLKPLPGRQGLSLSKKPRRVWRRKPPNKIKIIFCRGVYLTENTSQAASVRVVRRRRTRSARSRLQKLVGKARQGFFDSLKRDFSGGLACVIIQKNMRTTVLAPRCASTGRLGTMTRGSFAMPQ